MISVLPVAAADMQLLRAEHSVPQDSTCLFRAEENNQETGWFALRNDGDRIVIQRMEVLACADDAHMTEDDRYLAELMVRAAASYAINRMISTLQYDELCFRAFLQPFGFAEDADGHFLIDISKLLHGCGGHH